MFKLIVQFKLAAVHVDRFEIDNHPTLPREGRFTHLAIRYEQSEKQQYDSPHTRSAKCMAC